MKMLVLGSTGFMGRNITEFFSEKENYKVYGTSFKSLGFPKNVQVYTVNLTKNEHVNELFKSIKPDIVIQAAAVTSGSKDIVERPYIHVTDNVIMNSLILQACYDYSVRHFVFLSCGVMYQPGEEPRKEFDFNANDEIHKNYFGVGWTKVYVEKMCEFYSRLGKTKHTVIRHSNCYGPYDKYDLEKSHMFGATIRKVMDAKDGDEIEVWGNGEETKRDLIYVEDVVQFIDIVLTKQDKMFDIYNVGLGRAFSVKEVVEEIIKQSGKKLKIRYNSSKPIISTSLTLDCSKAWNLGFRTRTTFKDGVARTLDWYKKYYNSTK